MPEGGCRTENLTAGGIQFQQSETLINAVFFGENDCRAELHVIRAETHWRFRRKWP